MKALLGTQRFHVCLYAPAPSLFGWRFGGSRMSTFGTRASLSCRRSTGPSRVEQEIVVSLNEFTSASAIPQSEIWSYANRIHYIVKPTEYHFR